MTPETCRSLLEDARKAYHNLVTGQMARVVVDKDGSRVEFTAANKEALYNYILRLEAICGCGGAGSMSPGGPAGFLF
ncbi:hypothetical protein [Pseudomonas phage UF_RH7]|nr:hypothetical protein [Pseudomonas phage UF_RH7]